MSRRRRSGDGTLVRTSRFLSLILRHHPEIVGLSLDAGGWTEIDALLDACARHGRSISYDELRHVVEQNDKQRFVIRDGRIRASQGHSIAVDLALTPRVPPDRLFHGTSERALPRILEEGLRPMGRNHVHLSTDEETARAVGSRHGRPVLLRVRAGEMHEAGYPFFLSENGVWLTKRVPVSYLELGERP